MIGRQKKALNHINNMSECQRDAFSQLEQLESSPANSYADYCGRRYLDNYVGLGKCHLRLLFNVNSAAAAKAFSLGRRYGQSNEVFAVFNKDEDVSSGKVFYLRMSHWVVLQKVPESNTAVNYNDMVVMEIGNYVAAEAVLQLMESISASEYIRTFHGKPIVRQSKRSKT